MSLLDRWMFMINHDSTICNAISDGFISHTSTHHMSKQPQQLSGWLLIGFFQSSAKRWMYTRINFVNCDRFQVSIEMVGRLLNPVKRGQAARSNGITMA